MSAWSHAICNPCWKAFFGHGREPIAVREPEAETCCFCGLRTTAGIYVRHNPRLVHCKGNHDE